MKTRAPRVTGTALAMMLTFAGSVTNTTQLQALMAAAPAPAEPPTCRCTPIIKPPEQPGRPIEGMDNPNDNIPAPTTTNVGCVIPANKKCSDLPKETLKLCKTGPNPFLQCPGQLNSPPTSTGYIDVPAMPAPGGGFTCPTTVNNGKGDPNLPGNAGLPESKPNICMRCKYGKGWCSVPPFDPAKPDENKEILMYNCVGTGPGSPSYPTYPTPIPTPTTKTTTVGSTQYTVTSSVATSVFGYTSGAQTFVPSTTQADYCVDLEEASANEVIDLLDRELMEVNPLSTY